MTAGLVPVLFVSAIHNILWTSQTIKRCLHRLQANVLCLSLRAGG